MFIKLGDCSDPAMSNVTDVMNLHGTGCHRIAISGIV